MKDCLSAVGIMNWSYGYQTWEGCARRNWCNGGFRQALSNDLRSAFKEFNTITGTYYQGNLAGGNNQTTQDYFALAGEAEVNSQSNSTSKEANALTIFTWYRTPANRIKSVPGVSVSYWWLRSPSYKQSNYFCDVWYDGSRTVNSQSSNGGISPFGCM